MINLQLNFGGAGAMGCLTTAFVAGIGWRNQGWSDSKVRYVSVLLFAKSLTIKTLDLLTPSLITADSFSFQHPVKKSFNFLWAFLQPLLFGLIGTEIEVSIIIII